MRPCSATSPRSRPWPAPPPGRRSRSGRGHPVPLGRRRQRDGRPDGRRCVRHPASLRSWRSISAINSRRATGAGAPVAINVDELVTSWNGVLDKLTIRLAAQGPLHAAFGDLPYDLAAPRRRVTMASRRSCKAWSRRCEAPRAGERWRVRTAARDLTAA